MRMSEVNRYIHWHSKDLSYFVKGFADKSGCIVLVRADEKSIILAPKQQNIQEYIKLFPAQQEITKMPRLMSGVFFYADYEDDERGKATTKRNKDRSYNPELHSSVTIVFQDGIDSGSGTVPALAVVLCGYHDDRIDYNFGNVSLSYLRDRCKRISFDVAVKLIPSMIASSRLDEENC